MTSKSADPAPRQKLGRPTVAQSRGKMQEVLRVARREFVRNGYRATRLDTIAAAAGVAKRTLYLWHADKAALFLACVLEGALRFPPLNIDVDDDVEAALATYADALARELSAPSSFGMGRLILREAAEFPELAAASDHASTRYLVEPLARYLRRHGLEAPASLDRTRMLIAMMLVEVQRALLAGAPAPDPDTASRQARLGVELFLCASRPAGPRCAP